MTRHASLAEAMTAILERRNRPEGPVEPLQTNWTTVPEDIAPEEVADLHTDRIREMTPSIAEIRRAFENGGTSRNEAGQIVRIGSLEFSDGTRTEQATTYGPEGKLINYRATMPVGAMMHTKERLTRERGPSTKATISGTLLASIMKTEPPRHIAGSRKKTGGRIITRDESAAILAEAYANTPSPRITVCPPALACGSATPGDAYVGLTKGRKGESGAIAWEDISTMVAQREAWIEVERALADDDKRTLSEVETARTMKQIGMIHGFMGKRAERMGPAILRAANDNLQDAIKKVAA